MANTSSQALTLALGYFRSVLPHGISFASSSYTRIDSSSLHPLNSFSLSFGFMSDSAFTSPHTLPFKSLLSLQPALLLITSARSPPQPVSRFRSTHSQPSSASEFKTLNPYGITPNTIAFARSLRLTSIRPSSSLCPISNQHLPDFSVLLSQSPQVSLFSFKISLRTRLFALSSDH